MKALAWPVEKDTKLACVACALKLADGFEHLFFLTVTPKEVDADKPCEICGKAYGGATALGAAEYVLDTLEPERRLNHD